MALTATQQVRLLIQDTVPGLYILSDEEIEYFLESNNQSANRAAIAAAKVVLLNLSMRGDSTVDIFSIKSSKAAENYRLALQMFLKSPDLNPVLQNCQGYVAGVSLSDMQANDANPDNNIVQSAVFPRSTATDYFTI